MSKENLVREINNTVFTFIITNNHIPLEQIPPDAQQQLQDELEEALSNYLLSRTCLCKRVFMRLLF